MSRDYFGNLPLVSGMGFSRDVLLLEDCQGTGTWIKSATDANATVTFAAAAAFTGTYGMQLFAGDATPAENDIVSAQKLLSYPETGLLVARARVLLPDLSLAKQITLLLGDDSGIDEQYSGQLLIEPGTELAYINAAGVAVALAGDIVPVLNNQWLLMELAIDCRTHQYLSAAINGQRWDLAGTALYHPAATSGRASWIILNTVNAGAAAVTSYWDNISVAETLET